MVGQPSQTVRRELNRLELEGKAQRKFPDAVSELVARLPPSAALAVAPTRGWERRKAALNKYFAAERPDGQLTPGTVIERAFLTLKRA